MKTRSMKHRDFTTLLDWSKEEVETILNVALDLKQRTAIGEYHDHILRARSLFMIFYNSSLRTPNSFEAGMTQLGGHAHFLEPGKIYTPVRRRRSSTATSTGKPRPSMWLKPILTRSTCTACPRTEAGR